MASNTNDGDIHVRDTGAWLATIDTDELKNIKPIPVEIDIYIDGYIYTYSLCDRREDETKEETKDKFSGL